MKKKKSTNPINSAWLQWADCEEGIFRFAAPILLPLSLVYGGILKLRRSLYNKGWLKSTGFPVPIISIGNLTVGGVGKTPLTLYLIKLFQRYGIRPGVVIRGYGRKSKEPVVIVPGSFEPAKIEMYGDEAALIALTSEIPVGIGGDRVKVIDLLLSEIDCGVILLDDAFQHCQVKRDVDLVVLDGNKPIGNGRCLPYGPLREPVSALNHASAIVFHAKTLTDEHISLVPGQVEHFIGALEWLDIMPLKTWFQQKGLQGISLSRFIKKTVVLVSGIGSPDRLMRQAKSYGLTVHEHVRFPDHHWFSEEDVRSLSLRARGHPLLMTEKDAIRLIHNRKLPPELTGNCFVIRTHWVMQQAESFGQWMSDRLSNSGQTGDAVDSL